MSFFLHQYFGCGQTDWDSQYLSWEELYCATTALDGYPLHLDKIHYIWMMTSFYIYSTAFYKPWQSSLPSLSPSHSSFTSGQYLLPSKPSHLWDTSSTHSQHSHLSHLHIKR